MMKKKRIIINIIIMAIILLPLPSKAVLQANPNTNGKKTDGQLNWMTNIRNMEAKNQAMGLEEVIDTTTKKATSASNGIDVHMIKSTEWGTVAILSASGYGNPKWLQNSTIKSTTGNKSGVYFPLSHWENVAGGLDAGFNGIDKRYYNSYTSSYTSAKVGDALGRVNTNIPGCMEWHGGVNGGYWVASGEPYFVRGLSQLFSITYTKNGFYGRAAVVCGEGF